MKALLHTVACGIALSTAAPAQVVLRTQHGIDHTSSEGLTLEGFGDVTGDGVPDYAMGIAQDPLGGSAAGTVRIYSGVDGALVRTLVGDPGEFFGQEVVDVGDVDNDGLPDLAVSGYLYDNASVRAGRVRVFSGADGGELLRLEGASTFDHLGRSICALGDVNGDGHDDFVVAAEMWAIGSNGRVHIVSGSDGAYLATLFGSTGEQLGLRLSAAGDVNGDGVPDFAATKVLTYGVELRSGVDGTVIRTTSGPQDCLPIKMTAEADLDGDGTNDVLAGWAVDGAGANGEGIVCAYSGATGAPLFRIDGEDGRSTRFGDAVESLGDLDGDGRDDFAVAASTYTFSPGIEGAELFVYSGTGELFYRVIPVAVAPGGWEIAALPDIDGDGRTEVLFNYPNENDPGVYRGTFRIISGLRSVGTTTACTPVANSTGVPGMLAIFGPDYVGDDHLYLRVEGLPANQFGYILASQTTAVVPSVPGSQGVLCLGGTIGRFVGQVASSGAAGLLYAEVELDAMPPPLQSVQAGESWTFQAWHRDLNPGPTSNFSDAVTVDFQ